MVPREGEHIGPEDGDDAFTFRRREVGRPSRGLEEVLMGVALKQAKKKFEAREWADQDTDMLDLEDEEVGAEPTIKEGSHPPKPTVLIPVVSADDDRSRQLLRPSIRSMLPTLEKTLMALKHTMKTCRQYTSHSEATSGDDMEMESRPNSRTSSVGMYVCRPKCVIIFQRPIHLVHTWLTPL